jgi:predicted DNA-binding transcriptional regulator AlpA
VPKIERPQAACARLGVGKTMFDENYVDRGSNPVVPNTDIPRLRPVQLGPRAIGFFSDEIDDLIEALRRLRDTSPSKAPKTGDRMPAR